MKNFWKILIVFCLVWQISFSHAEVVRPAPEFSVETLNGGSRSLTSFAKQPIVLIIASSPKSRAFKKQLKQVESLYRQYAGRETLFVAAFTRENGVVTSDIPFLNARNSEVVAAQYGSEKEAFGLAVIGPDRNVDLLTNNVTSAEILRDVLDNSQTRQSIRRK